MNANATPRAVTYGRRVFCSDACMEAALEIFDRSPIKRFRVSTSVAHVMRCEGCGYYLNETETNNHA